MLISGTKPASDSEGILLLVNIRSCDLCGERHRPLFARNSEIQLMDFWREETALVSDLAETKTAMSSAYWRMCASCSKWLQMSLRYILKRKGLRIEPCGVPLCVENGPFSSPSMVKNTFLSEIRLLMNIRR